jgi:hypothetical protein
VRLRADLLKRSRLGPVDRSDWRGDRSDLHQQSEHVGRREPLGQRSGCPFDRMTTARAGGGDGRWCGRLGRCRRWDSDTEQLRELVRVELAARLEPSGWVPWTAFGRSGWRSFPLSRGALVVLLLYCAYYGIGEVSGVPGRGCTEQPLAGPAVLGFSAHPPGGESSSGGISSVRALRPRTRSLGSRRSPAVATLSSALLVGG